MNCVTGFSTGPSFGCAGNSGRIQSSAAMKSMYTPARMVAAQRRPDPIATPISVAGTANDIAR